MSLFRHARSMSVIIFASRLLGLAREAVAARVFGAGPVWSAFVFAFTIPNLFRKLLGEGALSAAFIPLYAKDRTPQFAASSINLLVLMLVGITLVGEALLGVMLLVADRPDFVLALKLTMVMLPYVIFVCGAALLSGILQVHERFGITALTSVVLNVVLLAAMGLTWWTDGSVFVLAVGVLVAGVLQVLILLPGLRACGFRFDPRAALWTPATKRMLLLTGPVALSAGIVQVGTLLDRGISFVLAEAPGAGPVLGLALPLHEGAAARLSYAQFLYQFPLGVFAVALATVIFPKLSTDDEAGFRATLRTGVEAALLIGIPASAGLALLAVPAVRFLFEGGAFDAFDTRWTAYSAAIYGSAIWAFSLQQIVSRGYYALHDTKTPLVWAGINLVANLAVELPLLWTPLREAGMAVATLCVFGVQSVAMLALLSRRVGGIGLGGVAGEAAKMLIATALMIGVLWFVGRVLPPMSWVQLLVLIPLGMAVYGTCVLGLRVRVLQRLRPLQRA
ncbi:MAG: murein biosynthesis integral membrane protein MurJ [Planctomycetota bacterium]